MGNDGIGYKSSGLASDKSDFKFRGCESRSGSESDKPALDSVGGAAAVNSDNSDDSDDSDDPELLCEECGGEMEEQRDTELQGMYNCCKRPVPAEEVTLGC